MAGSGQRLQRAQASRRSFLSALAGLSQSVRDALADAETLIRITQSAHGAESIATYYDGPAVFAAAKYGADLAWHMRSGALPSRRMILRPFRAAFRAVPALREVR